MNKVLPFDVVIYHSPCDDGHASAACLYMHAPNALFIGIRPGEVLLTEERASQLQGTCIVMVDVCITVFEMNILSSIASHVMVLDHHVSNATLYENLSWPNVDLCFDMDSPGCWLAWHLVNGKETPLPKALYYLGLRDIFKHKDIPDALYFTTAFECPKTWDEWTPYLYDDSDTLKLIISKGRIIYEYQQSVLKTMASKAEFTTWRGFRMSIVNVPYPWISDIGDMLCNDDNTIAVVWNKQVTGPFNVSLRSNGPNVAKIAAQFGGGGHAKASGFRTEIPPYRLFNGASFEKCLERAISKSVDEMQQYANDERCKPIFEALTSQDTPLECVRKAHACAKALEKNDFIAEYLKGLLVLNVQNELGTNGFEMIKL